MRQYEKYYRGFNSKFGSDHDHLLWVSYEPEYAAEYGDTVEEITIDETKLKSVSLFRLEDEYGIEYIDGPDEEQAQELLRRGYNCYGFEAGYGYDCLCIWDRSVVVSRRTLSPEELQSLTESPLKNIFRQFVNETLNNFDAQTYNKENNIPTRITSGEYDGVEYNPERIVQTFIGNEYMKLNKDFFSI